MYTPTKLAKMFNTSRTTVYTKMKDPSLQEFIIETKQGKQLSTEGISQFQLLMSESKVNTNKRDDNSQVNNILNDDYIKSLLYQIDDLKKDKENLITDKEKIMYELEQKNFIIKNQLDLIKNTQEKILFLAEPKKKSWWKFWKN